MVATVVVEKELIFSWQMLPTVVDCCAQSGIGEKLERFSVLTFYEQQWQQIVFQHL